uniref:Fibronectin type-III domain-containing protein n=1 Tax=Eiseniibacteriota bacterium TaxID=2212470 RepID=A0A832MNW4_UNCEI
MKRPAVRSRRRGPSPPAGGAPWRRWFPLALGLVLLFLAPVVAFAQGAGADSVTLSWTAPGDDGAIGTATQYELRYATAPISAGTWDQAVPAPGMPAPLVAGTRQAAVVRGLSRDTTYYFAIRTADDAGNWSGLSNLVRWDWVFDTAPPAAPTSVSATRQSDAVRVTWSPNAEPDLQGYSVYRATAAAGPFGLVTPSLVTGTTWLDTGVPQGLAAVWYRVSATDLAGNESAQSAAFRVDLATAGGLGADWTMSPAYPNPSRAGQPVCIPLVVPIEGAGAAEVQIEDAAGRRIRRIAVADAPSCSGGIAWDGRNDAGREVAPGVYRAWLVVGERREHVKLVRQP